MQQREDSTVRFKAGLPTTEAALHHRAYHSQTCNSGDQNDTCTDSEVLELLALKEESTHIPL